MPPINEDATLLLKELAKKYPAGSIMIASDIRIAKRFKTGSVSLDVALGGGWPGNHWVEIYGKESHGKTFLTYKTIAANQADDPTFTTLWVAAEHYDVDQAAALGVDNTRVIVHPTQGMEDAYDTIITFLEKKAVDCVVLDSYPALVPSEESEKSMEDATMALGARLTGKFFRKVGEVAQPNLLNNDRPYLGIFINQLRDAIGQFSPFGTPSTTPGGKAKNYAFYVRCETKRDDWIKEKRPGKGEVMVGQTVKVKSIKNKSAAPQQVAVFDIYFRDAPTLGFKRGDIDTVKEIVTMGVLLDVIEKRGPWFYFEKEKWQGKDALVEQLRYDLTLQGKITEAVMEAAANIEESRAITEEDVEAAENVGKRTVRKAEAEEA